jgi:hypothetical protein
MKSKGKICLPLLLKQQGKQNHKNKTNLKIYRSMQNFILSLSVIACFAFNAQAQNGWNRTHTQSTNGNGTQSAPYQMETARLYDSGQTYKSLSQQQPERERHLTMQKTNVPPATRHKDGETWWEPDTVLFYSDNGSMTRYLYSYTAQGLLSNWLFQVWQNNEWENSYKETYTYDNRNNLLTEISEIWQNNEWVNSSNRIYTYDDRNNQLTYQYQYWQNNNWENSSNRISTYDDRNNQLTAIGLSWQNNDWENIYNEIYTYDDRNNQLTYLSQSWQNNDWENNSKETSTYDDRNNRLTILPQVWQNNNWENSDKYTYTYDDRNNPLTYLWQEWQNNDWVNSWKVTYTYNDRNYPLTYLSQEWQNNNWENSRNNTITYDDRNNQLTSLYQIWQNNDWNSGYQEIYTYNEDNNAVSGENSMGYNISLSMYYNNMQSVQRYSCQRFTASYIKVAKPAAIAETGNGLENGIGIYPNPVQDVLHIQSSVTIEQAAIYDMNGRIVRQVQMTNDIAVQDLARGIYMIKIQTNKGIEIRKIVKQ